MNTEIAALQAALPTLSASSAGFANSLLTQFASKGSLSPEQMKWVRRLAQPLAPAPTADLSALVALFDGVQKKSPALLLKSEDGLKFRLSRAGDRAGQPGTINVADTAKSFDNRTWYGRIGLDGKFQPSRKIEQTTTDAVVAALVAFAADPEEAVAKYGIETGECCLCGHDLDNDISKKLGYGPICAKRWGLFHSYSAKKVCEQVAA